MDRNCDCIIPYYNEGERAIGVVEAVRSLARVRQIITVDDGSADPSTYRKIKQDYPRIISIRLEQNQGKAGAVEAGLLRSRAKYVLLLDGDLTHIQKKELDGAIEKITNNPNMDMIILRRVEDKTVTLSKYIRHDIIFSGQRILKSYDLKQVFGEKVVGYNLETAINSFMIRKGKKVYWVPFSGHNLFKHEKWGLKEGFINKGLSGFVRFMTSRDIIFQTLFFCRESVPESEKLPDWNLPGKDPVKALIIVAHPDDETIFCGGLMLLRPKWQWRVVCVTMQNQTSRPQEFKRAIELYRKYGVNIESAQTLAKRDEYQKLSDDEYSDWKESITRLKLHPDIVFTHGRSGEYNHPHHRAVHKIAHSIFTNIWGFYYRGLNIWENSNQQNVTAVKLTKEILNNKKMIFQKAYPTQQKVWFSIRAWRLMRDEFLSGYERFTHNG